MALPCVELILPRRSQETVCAGAGGEVGNQLHIKRPLTVTHYRDAREFTDWCDGDAELAIEMITWISERDITTLLAGLRKWKEVIDSAGSVESANKILDVMTP